MQKPPAAITSLSNPKIKDVFKLREGKYRRRAGKFLIDGKRELERACLSGFRILEVYLEVDRDKPSMSPANITPLDIVTYPVSEAVMKKIAYGDHNEGFVAVAEMSIQTLETFERSLAPKANPLLAVLEGVEKPGNLGAILRSADAAGIDGILTADSQVDPFHANTIRSSVGTVFHVPMMSGTSLTIKHWLEDRQYQIAATWCNNEKMSSPLPYIAIDFCRPTAIVFGCEATGLSPIWSGEGIMPITIPMLGIADSLNVSVAAGILFYEARRQRLTAS